MCKHRHPLSGPLLIFLHIATPYGLLPSVCQFQPEIKDIFSKFKAFDTSKAKKYFQNEGSIANQETF